MKIKTKTIMANPIFTCRIGDIIDISDKKGQELINKGYAEMIESEVKIEPEAIEVNIEQATQETKTESNKPKSKKKRR